MKCPKCHNEMIRTGDGVNYWYLCRHDGTTIGKKNAEAVISAEPDAVKTVTKDSQE